ncbi:MAG TPA: histidinol dehydrogenase, partial [Pirellulaceae bacterium]|nr:histidinol dehydrogenase [Pirellulaceae bacterium]
PGDLIQAAVYLAGGDALLCVGGAHAVAVLAYGATGEQDSHLMFETPCDLIVGPGNRWVTAAKKLVFGDVGIDMLAGPSELVVVADESADANVIASDLLAQAEHDTDATAMLVTTSSRLIDLTRVALERQLGDLPTAGTAREALRTSAAILCDNWEQAVAVVESFAPEHLELHGSVAVGLKNRFTRAGCVFVGPFAAEVFGDYGIGPNHTLPTNRTARFASGLSVLTFCRLMTWVEINEAPPSDLIRDTSELAHWEGLEAHARAALRRQSEPDSE